MARIPSLVEGDLIRILAPAKAIDQALLDQAKERIEHAGFKVDFGVNCSGSFNYFSGTIAQRTADFQAALDDPQVKAILCARGGYGCIHLVDRLKWAGLLEHPKWIVGFSDVTVFHQHLTTMNCPSIHGTMPLNFQDNSDRSLSLLFDALKGALLNYNWTPNAHNKSGAAEGQLVGGNLAVLCSLIGTKEMPDYQNTILFLEDVGEHLYAIDRYFFQLAKAGILDQIRGLVLGGFTSLRDTNPPYGKSYEEIIRSHFNYRNTPIAFNFPAGHQDDNCPLIFGQNAALSVSHDAVSLSLI
jgi:muramoyltetrapeptide carboxypeptidase